MSERDEETTGTTPIIGRAYRKRRPLTAIGVTRRPCDGLGHAGCYRLELHLDAQPYPPWLRALHQFRWVELGHDHARVDGRILSACVGESGEAVARIYLEALIDAANAEMARLDGGGERPVIP